MRSLSFKLTPEDNNRLNDLCGHCNENMHLIEQHLAVEVGQRGHAFKIFGPEPSIVKAKQLIEKLYADTTKGRTKRQELLVTLQDMANTLKRDQQPETEDADPSTILKTPRTIIKPRGPNQRRYIKRVLNNDINFGIGPAGTGKTFLAVACAVAALEAEKVRRIILVRPAVEAGENLGFLPGDLSQKVDPYLRPMYDALYELMGVEKVLKLIEKQVIEVAPLAFMRGRNLNDAFIILDESQNTTREQMKMFLTRLGFNSTAIITGDITQVDLPHNKKSGLRHVIGVLAEIEGISFTFFDAHDVVRHPLVQKVVTAYEDSESE